ncbi:MAG: hypothetical protein PHS44_07055 [Candidatus Dojkabacteria bacterium]|jgi:hypothetical protein|nr:hypothetical protein [Candidatus Dojkabacteria bacterium]
MTEVLSSGSFEPNTTEAFFMWCRTNINRLGRITMSRLVEAVCLMDESFAVLQGEEADRKIVSFLKLLESLRGTGSIKAWSEMAALKFQEKYGGEIDSWRLKVGNAIAPALDAVQDGRFDLALERLSYMD